MPIYLTPKGHDILNARLQKAKADLEEIRKEKAIAYSVSGDGWHDNPGFNQLQMNEQTKIGEICDLQAKKAEAVLCTVTPRRTDVVAIGSIVSCERINEKTGEMQSRTWEIVGYGEADPTNNRIGYDSPIARALLRLSPGESRTAHSPNGEVTYQVLGLYASWEEAMGSVEDSAALAGDQAGH